MNTKNIADFASWFATIAGFVFACIGIFSQPPTLETSRPQIANPAEEKKGEQKQASRSRTAELWDDPFAVFGPPKEMPDTDRAKTYKSQALLLVVLSDVGKYESDSEARLRDRYAIETALLNSGYISESPGELNSVAVNMNGTEMLVPVENFRRRVVQNAKIMQGSDNSFCFVEVAWLPERYLPSDSWENICAFLQGKQRDLAPQYSNCDLCILGPTGSNLLAQMCPVVQPAAPEIKGAVTYPRILNFEATAPSALTRIFALEGKETDEFYGMPKEKIISTLNNSQRWQGKQSILVTGGPQIIERLGADEFDLCRKLVSEIDRRTKTTGWGTKHVLLIAEWDTLYGRAAALAFELAAAGSKSYNLVRDAIDGAKPKHFDIDRFSYMRGLDGTATLYREEYPAEPVSPTKQSGKVEPSEGVSQFDYIRRLSDSIGTVPFFLSPTVREPDAIVILGSDVYDKLTLLKLLRTRFSRSLYATTGLDALYWSPEYVRYTRNMIVAASLPMEVVNVESDDNGSKSGDPHGAETPGASVEGLPNIKHLRKVVFRDSYQSALYQAVVCAIERKRVPDWTMTAKLFEVGNTQPVSIDASEWNRRATPMVWHGYFEGVNAAASLLFQAVLVVMGVIYLIRLRVLKYEQRRFPSEYYSNIESQLPKEFDGIIGEFQKLVDDLMEWSSRELPGKSEIIDIDRRARVLRDKVNAIPEVTETVAKEKKKDLVAALNRVLERLHPGATPGQDGSFLKNAEFDRILGRRKLRVRPSWIAKIVVPVIRSAGAPEERFSTEISEFEKYTDPKPFGQNPVYTTLGLVAIILFVVYFYFNPNFEGIVGTELRQVFLRWFRVVISLLGIGVMACVVVLTCAEQWRCRNLVNKLVAAVGERSALRDRDIIRVVATKSDDVANVAWKPCILLFLFYIGHLRSLAAPPFDLSHWLLFLAFLTAVSVSFFMLSSAVVHARRKVVSQYEEENLTAKRLVARVSSVVKGKKPLQDDLVSTATLLNELASHNSNLGEPETRARIEPGDLESEEVRKSVLIYLDALIRRNEQILSGVEDLRSGALSPFALTSMLGALLVPVGGVGGLTLLEAFVNQVR